MRLLLLLAMLFTACGIDEVNNRTRRNKPDAPIPDPEAWKIIGRAELDLRTQATLNVVLSSGSSTITSTIAETNTFSVTFTGVGFSLAVDPRSLGNLAIGTINFNKLKVCGVGGTTKCVLAQIHMYTTALVAFPGIDGFVNTTDGYGLPVWAGKASANAGIVDSYTIPANDNRLTNSDFGTTTYMMVADIVNAGAGNYQMVLVIEIVAQ